MKITRLAVDEAILGEIGERLARIRLDRNLTQEQLATQAGISKRTVERLEAGAIGTHLSGFIRVCRIFDIVERLNTLIPEPAPSPIEQLKMAGRRRRRASTVKPSVLSEKKWEWGDKS